ncbi:outer membrane lipoprotein [Natronocella acetinitrilica]|uniref:Outer membrane lipoprotein n=1 Tax=Natronocella acetinitrilica TaxID=414046 RepID=A0AAE3G1I8_9GAMM|nr:Slp family lipoprotein [Natronocella acetinitrilica]MCP1673001.1 outer membrane lipoprotein [Natronocella acetinitrilica]
MLNRYALILIGTSLIALLLTGCASGPGLSREEGLNTTLIASQAARDGAIGDRVVWGGRVIDNRSLEDGSLLEVLAYPLNRNEEPRTDTSAQGRFLVRESDFLEPEDYRAGRMITVRGEIVEIVSGQIGEADYRFPVIEPDALHLWPARGATAPAEPRVRFGVGVMISR